MGERAGVRYIMLVVESWLPIDDDDDDTLPFLVL
jgi:hypothetical protein